MMNKPEIKLPVTEIFQSLEGEGTKAGFLTTFIRLFGCNLRCFWCDTKYSYEPNKPAVYLGVCDIVSRIKEYRNQNICLTGGEPLLHGDRSIELIKQLAQLEAVLDIHVETNGSIDLAPFAGLREQDPAVGKKLRFIMDCKLPSSGETAQMLSANFDRLLDRDELKYVVADEQDFGAALENLQRWYCRGHILFSPVWSRMAPERLATLMIENNVNNGRLNLPLHRIIWDAKQGV
jgi:7-carboxy-7-deazaguanine synthase